jgi:GH18 family chitinase
MKFFPVPAALLACALALAGCMSEPPKPAPEPPRPKVVGYVPNWGDLKAFAATIDYAKVTHLNIAFENPTNDAGDMSFRAHNAALIQAAHARGVKVLVSIGGGSAAEDRVLKPRYLALVSPARRAAFAAKLAAYVTAHGFDGLDVDLEGPSINADYGPFIVELAARLRPAGKLLTAALSQGYGGARVSEAALAAFDFINVMAYDATGSWAPNRPGQHSSFEFARSNLDYWLKRGVPKTKLVLGVPFYGHAFGPAAAERRGGNGYKSIVARFPGAEQRDQSGETIYYNGIPTMRAKARLVREEGFAGVMIWSLDNDAPGEKSLLKVIDAELDPKAGGK